MVNNQTKSRSLNLRALLLLSILANIFISTTLYAANITVTTSRNPVALDDSFHLIYEADSSVDDDPDFSPIYKKFDVLNSSQSTNMRGVNGSWSMKKTWDLAVIAKNSGKFTIPPIQFGKDSSPAIRITITSSTSQNSATSNGQSSIPAKIFLESSLDKKTGWVQSQFIYTVRLLRTVSITSASLSEPGSNDPDAIIHAIGEDSYQTTRNGIRYKVIERRYAIFPQKSGLLKINPVTFEGRVNATQPRTIFDQFRISGQLKRLRSPEVTATVKAAPSNINLQDWLPASELQLIEDWSDDVHNITPGDPVTRTITIAATGLTAVQLPELSFADIDGMKQYPDKAITENRTESKGITGLKQIKVALIPAKAGTYTLPEIKLQWWNTRTNKKEIATIPEKVLTAIASSSANTNNIFTPAEPPATPITEVEKNISDNIPQQVTTPSADINIYWKWLALGFALAWLITLITLLKKSAKVAPSDKTKTTTTEQSIKPAYSAVVKHAKANDAKNTRSALIEWAKILYADEQITNLSQISDLCSASLASEIRQLNQSLYSKAHLSWDGCELLIALENEKTNSHNTDSNNSALKPLYNN